MSNWQIKKLGEIAEVRTGPFGAQLHEEDYVKDGTPIITVENLIGDVVRLRPNTPRVSAEDALRLHRYVLKEGDVVFSRVGSVDRSGYVEKTSAGWLFSGRLLRVRHGSQLEPKFLNYSLHQEKTKNLIRNLAVGGTMPSLNTEILNFIPIYYPLKPEQERIVKVLETWDKYLNKLEQKIALKEQLKKGLMQQLLVGKKRLSGFSGEWKQTTLGSIAKVNPSTNDLPDEFLYIDLEIVSSGRLTGQPVKLAKAKAPSRAQRVLKKFDVLFQTVRPYQKNNLLFNLDGIYVASTGYAQLRANNSSEFLYHFLQSDEFVKDVLRMCTGSNYPAITSGDLSKIKVWYPGPDEQVAIERILSTADIEIANLNTKHDQTTRQKEYLLKNLVTGTIRTPETLTPKGVN